MLYSTRTVKSITYNILNSIAVLYKCPTNMLIETKRQLITESWPGCFQRLEPFLSYSPKDPYFASNHFRQVVSAFFDNLHSPNILLYCSQDTIWLHMCHNGGMVWRSCKAFTHAILSLEMSTQKL